MDWQEYAVWVIGAAVAVLLARRLWCFFRHRKRGGCASCGSTQCPMRKLPHKDKRR